MVRPAEIKSSSWLFIFIALVIILASYFVVTCSDDPSKGPLEPEYTPEGVILMIQQRMEADAMGLAAGEETEGPELIERRDEYVESWQNGTWNAQWEYDYWYVSTRHDLGTGLRYVTGWVVYEDGTIRFLGVSDY